MKTTKIARKVVNILDVKLDSTSLPSVLRFIRLNLKLDRKFLIVTPNPEHILKAQSDNDFKNILNSANLSLPDGIGIIAASKFLILPNPENIIRRLLVLPVQGLGVGFSVLFDREWLSSELELIHGRKLFMELIELGNKMSWKVVLLGDRLKSAQNAKKILERNYQTINISAVEGPNLNSDGSCVTKEDNIIEEQAISKINEIKPELLFIGFGAPEQEKWIHKWFTKLNLTGAMVVGGTFDYISGKAKAPPKFLEKLELEWLWRLIREPKRLKRITSAVAGFPYKVFEYKLYEGYR